MNEKAFARAFLTERKNIAGEGYCYRFFVVAPWGRFATLYAPARQVDSDASETTFGCEITDSLRGTEWLTPVTLTPHWTCDVQFAVGKLFPGASLSDVSNFLDWARERSVQEPVLYPARYAKHTKYEDFIGALRLADVPPGPFVRTGAARYADLIF